MIRHVLRLGAAALVAAGLCAGLAAPLPALGGSLDRVEAWLDAPVPTDAEPGTTVTIGAMIWHATDGAPFVLQSIVIEPYDRADPETPLEPVRASPDWPGHFVAEVEVPPGGLDRVVVGLLGSTCDDSGDCVPGVLGFDEGGIGPPPEAPLPEIANVTTDVLTTPAVSGEPIDVELSLDHRAPWSRALAPYPEALGVMLRPPRGEAVVEAEAVLVDADTGRYVAAIPAPDPGDYVVDVTTGPETTTGDVFTRSTQRITVEAPDAAPPPAVGEGAGIDLILLVAIVATGLVLGAIGVAAIRRLG